MKPRWFTVQEHLWLDCLQTYRKTSRQDEKKNMGAKKDIVRQFDTQSVLWLCFSSKKLINRMRTAVDFECSKDVTEEIGNKNQRHVQADVSMPTKVA